MNYITKYYKLIESGQQLVNYKIRTAYKKLNEDLSNKKTNWEYSHDHAMHVINFIETFCRHSKGKWANEKVRLELWQKALISATYGFVDKKSRIRRYNELVLLIPRKSGKSLLASCLAIYHFVADGEKGAENYSIATTMQQGMIVFNESRLMVKKSPQLRELIDVRKYDLWFETTESKYRALASDSHSLDGLNSSCVIADEIHAWTDVNLYDVMKDSMIAREQPMMLVISTMGTVRDSAFDMVYKNAEARLSKPSEEARTLDIIYELDEPLKNIHKPEMWGMCHPMLEITIKEQTLMEKYKKALVDNSQLPNFLTKYFNVRATSSVSWLQFDQYNNETTFDYTKEGFRYCIGGVDLSKNDDWTAASILMRKSENDEFYIETMYFITSDMFEKQKARLPLESWLSKGYIKISGELKVNYHDVVNWFREVQEIHDIYIFKIGFDRYEADLFIEKTSEMFGDHAIQKIAQGAITLSAPMKYVGRLFDAKKIVYNNNPITKMHIGNAIVLVDSNGNIKPNKGKDTNKKIDGLASILNAFVVYLDETDYFESLI